MPFTLDPETKQRLHASLAAFCREELEIDPGLLVTERLLDHVVGAVAAEAYNQAVADAVAWMQARLLDLEGDLHEEGPST